MYELPNQPTADDITRALLLHRAWLSDTPGGLQADFTKCEAPRADFHGADLRDAIFSEANLTGADFSGANLVGADFRDADLTHANFTGANLDSTTFDGADLTNANFTGANLEYSDYKYARSLEGAIFTDANLLNTDF